MSYQKPALSVGDRVELVLRDFGGERGVVVCVQHPKLLWPIVVRWDVNGSTSAWAEEQLVKLSALDLIAEAITSNGEKAEHHE